MRDPRRRAKLLLVGVGLGLLGLPALERALAQSRAPAEPELAPLEDRNLIHAVEAGLAANDERVISDLETLLGRVSRRGAAGEARNAAGNFMLEIPIEGSDRVRLETSRHAAFRLTRRLSREVKKKLADTQVAALATERARGADDEERLLERYPLVPDAVAWAERLASRAIESSDELGAASLDRLAGRLETLATGQAALRSPGSRIRRALSLLAARDFDGALDELRRASKALDPRNPADAGTLRTLALVQKRVEAGAASRGRLEARQPPEGTVADLLASFRFSRPRPDQKDTLPSGGFASPVAAHVGSLVFASDGSRVLVVDADSAELEGKLPQEDDEVAPPGTQVVGTVSSYGDLVFAPLFFEDFLLPARKSAADAAGHARDADATVRGGYYSLFAFDAPARRLAWWDGDAGTHADTAEDSPLGRGRPAGMGDLDDASWRRMARSHVIGKPLACGRRVYVALTTTSSGEPQVWVAAYERATSEEQGLALVPAWHTFVASSLQLGPANVAPSAGSPNPRLALDPDGRVLVQTDLGVAAALDARTGAIEWLARLADEEEALAPRPLRPRAEDTRTFQATNDPPVVVPARGSHVGVVVLASLEQRRFLGLSVEDGSTVWKMDVGDVGFSYTGAESLRVASLGADVVALYGGLRVVLVDGLTGKMLSRAAVSLEPGEWPSGPLAHAGARAFVLPIVGGRARVGRFSIRRGTPFDRGVDDRDQIPLEATLTVGDGFALREVDGPVGLVCLEDRLVAVTGSCVNVYAWHKPD